jgi:emfourin
MEDLYIIERRGGFAGLKASGTVKGDALDPGDRATLEELLNSDVALARDPGADRYTYVVTRHNAMGSTTREIPESVLPSTVARVVREVI